MKWIVDAVQDHFVTLENEACQTITLPKDFFSKALAEGDVLVVAIDKIKTKERSEKIKGLMDDLFKD